jgi:hypothetical protein
MNKPRRSNANARNRGSAFLTAVGSLGILAILGTAILSTTVQGLHLTRRQSQQAQSFNIAESGAERAVRWLKDRPYPPSELTPIDPFGGVQTLGDGSYHAIIYPDPNNSGSSLRMYTIVSTGTLGTRTEVVELVVREQSFGKYAYFTDKEVSSVSGGAIWFIAQDRIRGPAHSNNKDGSNFRISWGGASPIFEDIVTSAGPTINYQPRRPTSEPDFLQIFRTGSRGYHLDVDPIPLPDSSDVQRDAAWGSNFGFPGVNGVYVPTDGGIYVRGSSNVTMSVDAGGNQVFNITQAPNTTSITVDLRNNQRVVRVNGGPATTIAGSGTGVLYSTSTINSLSGTIANNYTTAPPNRQIIERNAYTIATNVNGGANITVTGPITYESQPDPNQHINSDVNMLPGTLGLVARNVMISSGAPRNMQIDAIVLAGSESTTDGSFYVQNYNTRVPTGTLRLMGGIIQKARGPVGTFSGGLLSTGYAKDYYYDPRLADRPPPYFPTTGLYDRMSWRRLPDN